MDGVFCFDDFELDVALAQLRRSGVPLKVDALVLRLLEVFVRSPGRLILKEELVARVWDGRAVSENALTVAIARLRKTLADKRGSSEFLLTVHGRGYRFLRAVSLAQNEPASRSEAVASAAPFVGRELILAQLNAALTEARNGSGSVIVLHGEAGIGKTRVAEVLAHQASIAGVSVAWGYCRELGETPPLWPVVGLLRAVISRVPSAVRADARFADLWPDLALLLPELADCIETNTPAAGAAKPSAKHRVFDAVMRALTLAAERSPLLLILDDIHRADDASFELLHYVLAEVPRTRILLVATMRSATRLSANEAVARVLGHRNCLRIPLRPLNEAQVSSYVVALFASADQKLCRAVFEISEGNPFYMTELARQLRNSEAQDASALVVPRVALELLRQRLAMLDDSAREVLTCAAVIGRSFSLPLLQAVAGRSPADLVVNLDAAVASDVIAPEPGSTTGYVFTHELLRAALYEAQSAAERRSWHLRVSQVLDQRLQLAEMPIADLAYHAHCALPDGDLRKAVHYCTEAADAAERVYAFVEAIRYLQYAREALDLMEHPSPRLRFALLLRQAMLVRGHSARDFVPLAEQLLRLARDQGGGVPLAHASLLLDPFPGFPRLPLVHNALSDALASLPEGAPSFRAALMARLASSAPLAYDTAASSAQIERALELAAHSPELTDRFSAHFGELYLYGGPAHNARTSDALIALQRLCNEQAPSAPLPPILLDLHRALTALQRGDLPTMTRALERCELRCRDLDSELLWHVERFRALSRINQGYGAQGRTELLELQRRAQQQGATFGAELFCAYDQILLAAPSKRETESLAVLTADPRDPPNIWALKVRTLAAAGALDEARNALSRVPAESLATLPCDREFLGTLGALARAALRLNADDYARSIYEQLSPYPDYFAANLSFFCEGSVSLLLGLLARRLGDLPSARRHFEAAIEMSEQAGLPLSAAEARLELNRS